MNELEERILKKFIAELHELSGEKAKVWYAMKILEDHISELPDGEIKKFFQKIKEDRSLAEQVAKKKGVRKLKKFKATFKILMEIHERIKKGDFPKDIPQEIIQLYTQVLALETFMGMLAIKSLEGKLVFIDKSSNK